MCLGSSVVGDGRMAGTRCVVEDCFTRVVVKMSANVFDRSAGRSRCIVEDCHASRCSGVESSVVNNVHLGVGRSRCVVENYLGTVYEGLKNAATVDDAGAANNQVAADDPIRRDG